MQSHSPAEFFCDAFDLERKRIFVTAFIFDRYHVGCGPAEICSIAPYPRPVRFDVVIGENDPKLIVRTPDLSPSAKTESDWLE